MNTKPYSPFVDGEGNLHPFDELRRGIWNVRVFNHKYEEIISGIRSNHLALPVFEQHCAFDRVLPEIEFWHDKTDPQGQAPCGNNKLQYRINDAYNALIAVLDYANCSSELLQSCGFKVDAWISHFTSHSDVGCGHSYVYYDPNTNQPYDPDNTNINEQMSYEIDLRTSQVYVAAFNNTPCKAFYSSGGSSKRNFRYTASVFNDNDYPQTLINPVFNTKQANHGLHDFLIQRVSNGDPYNGTFGKVESAFNNELTNDPVSVDWGALNNYSWYRREEAFSNGFYKKPAGIEGANNQHILIYPNPADGKVIVESKKVPVKYELHNINGQIMRQGRIENNTQQIDVSDIPPGVYLIKVGDRNIKKLLVQ